MSSFRRSLTSLSWLTVPPPPASPTFPTSFSAPTSPVRPTTATTLSSGCVEGGSPVWISPAKEIEKEHARTLKLNASPHTSILTITAQIEGHFSLPATSVVLLYRSRVCPPTAAISQLETDPSKALFLDPNLGIEWGSLSWSKTEFVGQYQALEMHDDTVHEEDQNHEERSGEEVKEEAEEAVEEAKGVEGEMKEKVEFEDDGKTWEEKIKDLEKDVEVETGFEIRNEKMSLDAHAVESAEKHAEKRQEAPPGCCIIM